MLYGSFRNLVPTATQSQTSKTGRPKQITVYPDGDERAKTFGQYTFYYISIESEYGVMITPSFATKAYEEEEKEVYRAPLTLGGQLAQCLKRKV